MKKNGVAIAVNGTYFDAYSGNPAPMGAVVKDNKVINIIDKNFTVAKGTSVVLMQPTALSNFHRYYKINIGDDLKIPFKPVPKFDNPALWENVVAAVSAGPLLVKTVMLLLMQRPKDLWNKRF